MRGRVNPPEEAHFSLGFLGFRIANPRGAVWVRPQPLTPAAMLTLSTEIVTTDSVA